MATRSQVAAAAVLVGGMGSHLKAGGGGGGGSAASPQSPAMPGCCSTTAADDVQSPKLRSSVYKGVVPQPNGRWGAQIYERHGRLWLGTFSSQDEAARAYDTVAQRLRGRAAVTNFPSLSEAAAAGDAAAAAELDFLASKSAGDIVDMMRKHSYLDELAHSHSASSKGGAEVPREYLFAKTVTPSDVGRLNRLVVPKHYAEKYLPAPKKGLLLHLEDGMGRVWRFRYSYWGSSQSYVLTRGWSRFVKENQLRAGDVVGFYRLGGEERLKFFIECGKPGSALPSALAAKSRTLRLLGVDVVISPAKRPSEVDATAAAKKRSVAVAVA